jgi:hypothetical protein
MTLPLTALLGSIVISGVWRVAMLIPLSLSVALVYKTTRCRQVRDIPMAVVGLWLTIVLGMYAVGVAAWLVFMICVEWTA